jgi:hypothetical protein
MGKRKQEKGYPVGKFQKRLHGLDQHYTHLGFDFHVRLYRRTDGGFTASLDWHYCSEDTYRFEVGISRADIIEILKKEVKELAKNKPEIIRTKIVRKAPKPKKAPKPFYTLRHPAPKKPVKKKVVKPKPVKKKPVKKKVVKVVKPVIKEQVKGVKVISKDKIEIDGKEFKIKQMGE